MVTATISIADPLKLNVPPATYQLPNNNVEGRQIVSPFLAPGEKTVVIVSLGQSLLANYTQGPYNIVNAAKIQNLNIVNGGLYQAQNTMLGIDGTLTSVMPRVADRVISNGKAARVILVPISAGGSDVAQWGYGGVFNQRIEIAMRRLASVSLAPTAVIWQQGTTDNSLNTSAAVYQQLGQEMIDTWRGIDAVCPIFVGKESFVPGIGNDAEVRAGQAALVNPASLVYEGADFDTITGRYDDVHFTSASGDIASQRIYEKIAPYL